MKKSFPFAAALLSTASASQAKPADIVAHLLKPGVRTLAF